MAQLRQRQPDLNRLDVTVLLVTFNERSEAQQWVAETGITFPLLLDTGRLVYKAFDLERSYVRSWSLRTIWRYAVLLLSGRRWRGIQGDSSQLGADFLIDSKGTIRFVHYSDDPTDRPSWETLQAVLNNLASEQEVSHE